MGLIVFNIFINDLAYVINESRLLSFADDANLYASSQCLCVVENMINQDLFDASLWLKQNRMITNLTKYNSMVLGNVYQRNISIKYVGKQIVVSKEIKLLQ